MCGDNETWVWCSVAREVYCSDGVGEIEDKGSNSVVVISLIITGVGVCNSLLSAVVIELSE